VLFPSVDATHPARRLRDVTLATTLAKHPAFCVALTDRSCQILFRFDTDQGRLSADRDEGFADVGVIRIDQYLQLRRQENVVR
jgi:hypothetical protein